MRVDIPVLHNTLAQLSVHEINNDFQYYRKAVFIYCNYSIGRSHFGLRSA